MIWKFYELKICLHLAALLLVELSDGCRPRSIFSPFSTLADAVLMKIAMQIAATVTCRIVASKRTRMTSSYTFESGSWYLIRLINSLISRFRYLF